MVHLAVNLQNKRLIFITIELKIVCTYAETVKRSKDGVIQLKNPYPCK